MSFQLFDRERYETDSQCLPFHPFVPVWQRIQLIRIFSGQHLLHITKWGLKECDFHDRRDHLTWYWLDGNLTKYKNEQAHFRSQSPKFRTHGSFSELGIVINGWSQSWSEFLSSNNDTIFIIIVIFWFWSVNENRLSFSDICIIQMIYNILREISLNHQSAINDCWTKVHIFTLGHWIRTWCNPIHHNEVIDSLNFV
jgi:hypothetical protein